MTRELSSLQNWVYANRLIINYDPEKSCFSTFCPPTKQLSETATEGLQIHNNILTHQNKTTYLGLILDTSLTWQEHIRELNKKLIKYAGIFSKLRYTVPSRSRVILYNAFVHSRLNYDVEIYANRNKKLLHPLKITQNKILKILQFKKRKSETNVLYEEFKVLKVEDLHMYNTFCLMQKIIHHPQTVPAAINKLLTLHKNVHNHDTRNKNDIHATNINHLTYGGRKLNYKGRNYWNNLPVQLKQETKIKTFKENLKAQNLSQYK